MIRSLQGNKSGTYLNHNGVHQRWPAACYPGHMHLRTPGAISDISPALAAVEVEALSRSVEAIWEDRINGDNVQLLPPCWRLHPGVSTPDQLAPSPAFNPPRSSISPTASPSPTTVVSIPRRRAYLRTFEVPDLLARRQTEHGDRFIF
jgi:hypothetical protein